jgi:NADH-quinone oxidoreductase subunit J
LPVGGLIGLILLVELLVIVGGWAAAPEAASGRSAATPLSPTTTNTHALGEIIYTDYLLLFQTAGVILLVAMVGAIVLTFRRRPGVRRQRIADQVARRGTVEVRKVPTGKGI